MSTCQLVRSAATINSLLHLINTPSILGQIPIYRMYILHMGPGCLISGPLTKYGIGNSLRFSPKEAHIDFAQFSW